MTWQLWDNVWCLVAVQFSKGIALLGPDWRPIWRNANSLDVAGLLADAELVLDIEKVAQPEQNQRRLALAARRAELVHNFMHRFPGYRRLEVLAQDIDRHRLYYECSVRKIGAPPIERNRKTGNGIREAATTLERELRRELSELGSYNINDPNEVEIIEEHNKLLDQLSSFRVVHQKRFEVPWHRFARIMYREYMVAFLPVNLTGWTDAFAHSRSHNSSQVRFVQQALGHIGVKTVTRSAIYNAVYRPEGQIRAAWTYFMKPASTVMPAYTLSTMYMPAEPYYPGQAA